METKIVNIYTSEVPTGQVPFHLLLEGLVRVLILQDIYLHIRKESLSLEFRYLQRW